MKWLSGRARTWAWVAVFVVMALGGAEAVLLQGDEVASDTLNVSAGKSATLQISRVGEKHLVEIYIQKLRDAKIKGAVLEFRFEGPDGAVLYRDSEFTPKRMRMFEFVPEKAGPHRLILEDGTMVLNVGKRSAEVTVYVNDRTILRRLLPYL